MPAMTFIPGLNSTSRSSNARKFLISKCFRYMTYPTKGCASHHHTGRAGSRHASTQENQSHGQETAEISNTAPSSYRNSHLPDVRASPGGLSLLSFFLIVPASTLRIDWLLPPLRDNRAATSDENPRLFLFTRRTYSNCSLCPLPVPKPQKKHSASYAKLNAHGSPHPRKAVGRRKDQREREPHKPHARKVH